MNTSTDNQSIEADALPRQKVPPFLGPRAAGLPSPIRPKVIDTWDIPFPKSLDELAALNATREVPYLKALCNRRHIRTAGPNPTPTEIIPIIQEILNHHLTLKPKNAFETSDITVEWRLIRDDLAEFVTNLRTLLPADINPRGSRGDEDPTKLALSTRFTPEAAPRKKIANQNSGHDAPPLPLGEGRGEGSSPIESTPKPSSTPRHFHVSNDTPPKTPAISTPPLTQPKTFGHFHDSPQKISLEEPATFSPSSFPSLPSVKSEPISQTSPAKKSPRIKPLLSTLSDQTKQMIIAFCEETDSYKQAAQKIHQHLGIKLSVKSLCKLYTTHNVTEDQQTREELEAAANSQNQNHKPKDIRAIAKQQLELRLLELSARRDHDTSQLKELFQIVTRLEALDLSERRVQVAEKREARMNQIHQTHQTPAAPTIVTQEEMTHYVKRLLGKEITIGDDLPPQNALEESQRPQKISQTASKEPFCPSFPFDPSGDHR